MRRKAFTRRSTLQASACALGVLLSASVNSQSSPSAPPADGSVVAARNLNAMWWLRSALGVGLPTATLFMEQPVASVINAPYSAVGDTESVTRFPDGNRIVQTTSVRYYRDGQGRTRIERPLPGIDSAETVMINDIVSGQHYILHPQAKMAQVLKVPATQPAAQPVTRQPPVPAPEGGIQSLLTGGGLALGSTASSQASTNAPSTVSLGQKDMEGVTTIGSRWEQTFAAGTIGNDKPITVVVEQWYSSDLGVVVAASQRTSTGAELTYRVHNITRNEPDSALFAIPADYTRHEGQSMVMTAIRKD
jgi:hypothetical protein